MPLSLPELPYAENALEPVIDQATMNIHRTKHHNAYVTNANKALEAHPTLASKSADELCADLNAVPESIRTTIRNNAGGHFNHSPFWTVMALPGTGGQPAGDLMNAITAAFGGFDEFKTQFAAAAAGRFGSGWVWLGVKPDGSLVLTSTPNQDNPLMKGFVDTLCTPILGLDVWEHAYYLKYQNKRPDYVSAWWGVVNWNEVARRFVGIDPKPEPAPDRTHPIRGQGVRLSPLMTVSNSLRWASTVFAGPSNRTVVIPFSFMTIAAICI